MVIYLETKSTLHTFFKFYLGQGHICLASLYTIDLFEIHNAVNTKRINGFDERRIRLMHYIKGWLNQK